ncbi:MAG: guanylate kinase [Bacteroidales bacterium]|nr:guanylate kinase [Bacteroidales bacterium]MCF8327126.1 guanylate kinase [Bacteroidales bacterium]
MEGKLIIFSAPSGAGKTTIVHRVLEKFNNIEFSISATTRQPRSGEKHGEDYYFLSVPDFKRRIIKNEFIEYEAVYQNQFYGTLKSELERIWKKGKHVIFDVDVQGGLNIKKQYPKKALAIFIMPPGLEILEKRLLSRAKDDERSIKERLNKARLELTYAHDFDKVIVNEDLDEAVNEAIQIINNFLNSNGSDK